MLFETISAKSIINDVKTHIRADKLSSPKDIVAPELRALCTEFCAGIISKGNFSKKPKLVPFGFKKSIKQTEYTR